MKQLIERLRELEAEYAEWSLMDEPHARDQAREVMQHLPQLLDRLEALERVAEITNRCVRKYTGHEFQCGEIEAALAALEECK